MVMLFSKEAATGAKIGGSQLIGCCDPGVRFKSLLWYSFNYSKQNSVDGCIGFVWQGFGSWGATRVASVRSC